MADKKRRRIEDPFDFFDDDIFDFEGMRRMMDDLMRKAMESGLDEFGRGEPIVYGFNIRIGPDGKPKIQQFGNVKPTVRGPTISETREPLVDVIEREDTITVIVELPGVDKNKIKLNATERVLTISAPGDEREFYKEVKLPAPVNSKNAKATYKNGVLEVCLEKKEKSKPKPESIPIE